MEWKIRMRLIVAIVCQRTTTHHFKGLKCVYKLVAYRHEAGERGATSPGNDITILVKRQIVLYRVAREPSAVHIGEKVVVVLLLLLHGLSSLDAASNNFRSRLSPAVSHS